MLDSFAFLAYEPRISIVVQKQAQRRQPQKPTYLTEDTRKGEGWSVVWVHSEPALSGG